MSMNVGELHAIMTMDDRDFQQKLQRGKKDFLSLGNIIKSGTKAIATGFAGATTITAGLGLAALKVGLEYNKLQQNSRAALTTIMGSGKAAADQMDRLDKFAATSPFAKDVFIAAQQQLLAFGMEAEKVIPTLDAVQNAVAAAGGSSQQLSDVVFVLAQIQAAGKITATDLMQLGQRGIDAATVIGSAMGKTGPEIRQMITKGILPVDQALDALTKGLTAKFGGATAKLKEQWSGAQDRIKAGWRDLGAVMARPLINPNSGGWLVTWGNQVADILQSVRKKAEPLLALAEVKAGPALKGITSALTQMRQGIDRIDLTKLVGGLKNVAEYAPLISAVATALFTLGAGSVPVLGRFVGAVNPVVAGLAALVATHPGLREVAAVFGREFAQAAPVLLEIARAAADAANPVIDALVPGLKVLAEVAPGIASIMAGMLVPAIEAAGHVAKPAAELVSTLATGIAAVPQPVIAAAGAFLILSKALGALKALSVAQSLGAMFANAGAWAGQIRSVADAGTVLKVAMGSAVAPIRGVGNALKAAFITNPIGLAIAGIATALAIFVARKEEAKQRTQELSAALKESNGVMDDNVRAIVANQLETEGAIAAYELMGGKASDLVDALAGTESQMESGAAAIAKIRDEQRGMIDETGTAAAVYGDFASKFDRVKASTEDAIEATERERRARGETTTKIEEQTQSLRELADAQRDNANAAMEVERAEAKWFEGRDKHAANLERLREAEAKFGSALAATKDAWNLQNEAGRIGRDIMEDRIKAAGNVITAMQQEGASSAVLNAKRKELVGTLVEEMVQYGWNRDAAQKYVEQLLGIPKDVKTKAQLEISQALKDKDNLVFEIDSAKGTVTVDGNTLPANTTLEQLIGEVNASDGTVDILGDKLPGEMTLGQYVKKIMESEGTTKIKGNASSGYSTLYTFRTAAGKTVTVPVNADTSAAQQKIAALRQQFNALNSRTWHAPMLPGFGKLEQADGGVVEYYRAGGLREQHVAQIAPAGAWRVWAEEETGGEAYIPLAMSKRARSTAILDEVANRFGYLLVPAAARAFANGTSGASPTVQVAAPTVTATLDADAIGRVLAGILAPATEDAIRRGFSDWLTQQFHEARMGGGY